MSATLMLNGTTERRVIFTMTRNGAPSSSCRLTPRNRLNPGLLARSIRRAMLTRHEIGNAAPVCAQTQYFLRVMLVTISSTYGTRQR